MPSVFFLYPSAPFPFILILSNVIDARSGSIPITRPPYTYIRPPRGFSNGALRPCHSQTNIYSSIGIHIKHCIQHVFPFCLFFQLFDFFAASFFVLCCFRKVLLRRTSCPPPPLLHPPSLLPFPSHLRFARGHPTST